MARHIGEKVREILEDPDPTMSARLVLVTDNVDPNEIKRRVEAAEGDIRRSLPNGITIVEVPEEAVEIICEGDLIESVSLDGRLQLA